MALLQSVEDPKINEQRHGVQYQQNEEERDPNHEVPSGFINESVLLLRIGRSGSEDRDANIAIKTHNQLFHRFHHGDRHKECTQTVYCPLMRVVIIGAG